MVQEGGRERRYLLLVPCGDDELPQSRHYDHNHDNHNALFYFVIIFLEFTSDSGEEEVVN